MALSGGGTSSQDYFGNTHYKIEVDWSATQSVTGNYSTVTAVLWFWSDPSWNINVSAKPATLSIAGTTYSFTKAINSAGGSWVSLGSYTKQVNHNSDGTMPNLVVTGSYDLTGITITNAMGKASVSNTYALDTIARASTLTSGQNWTAGGSTTFQISRADASFTHDIQVEVYNGSTYVVVETITGVGTSYAWTPVDADMTTIFDYLNNDTVSYDQPSRITLTTKSGSTVIGSNQYTGSISSPAASTVSTSADFNIGDVVNITISRAYSSLVHKVQIYVAGILIHTSPTSTVGTSYTWTPTAGEITAMYNATANGASGTSRIDITTYYDSATTDQQVRDITSKAGTATVTNSLPTFTTFTYLDNNSAVTTVTGNNQWVVQNKSLLRAVVTSGNAAVPKNSATIAKYIASFAGQSVTILAPFTFPLNFDFAVANVSVDTNLSITAYDSRGFTVTPTPTVVKVAPWSPPIVNTSAARTNGFLAETILTLAGSISPVAIAGVNKNTLDSSNVKYQYKESTVGSYGSFILFTGQVLTMPTYTATSASINSPTGLDINKAYDINVVVTDKFGSNSAVTSIGTGVPIMFIDDVLKSASFGKLPTTATTLDIAWDVNIDKILTVNNGGGTLKLKAGSQDHVYMELYADSQAPNTRSGYFGYGAGGTTDFYFVNEMSGGSIFLKPNSGAVRVVGTSSGGTNVGYLGFFESDGVTRKGYIGDGSSGNSDITIQSDVGSLVLVAANTNTVIIGNSGSTLSLPNGNFRIDNAGLTTAIRLVTDTNNAYVQAGKDLNDTTAQLIIARTGTTGATISKLIINASALQFWGLGTTASAGNTFLDGSNNVLKSTSSIRYKTDVEDLWETEYDRILDLRPVWYRSLADADRKDWSYVGLIAEEVAQVEPRLVHYLQPDDKQAQEIGVAELTPNGVQYDRLAVYLLPIIKRHELTIKQLQADIATLKGAS